MPSIHWDILEDIENCLKEEGIMRPRLLKISRALREEIRVQAKAEERKPERFKRLKERRRELGMKMKAKPRQQLVKGTFPWEAEFMKREVARKEKEAAQEAKEA